MLVINLDETFVPFYYGNVTGNLAIANKSLPKGAMPLTQEASRNQQRMGLTHVGIICNIPAVQRLLPQVLIVPSRYLLLRDLPAVRAAMPPTISVVRAKSKWISKPIMVWIVRLLAWTLRPLRRRYRVALLMDVLGIHIDTAVTDAATDADIDLLFVPALLTWLSQPCDTHAFSLYKRHLRGLFLSFRSSHGLGMPTVLQWLLMIRDTIVLFLNERPWMRAFIEDGFSRGQEGVSDYILAHLPKAYALPAPSTVPTDDHLRLIFPKTRINLNFAAFRAPPPKPPCHFLRVPVVHSHCHHRPHLPLFEGCLWVLKHQTLLLWRNRLCLF